MHCAPRANAPDGEVHDSGVFLKEECVFVEAFDVDDNVRR